MKKIFCKIDEKYSSFNGEIVRLFEGPEILKEHGVKRFFIDERGKRRYDNFDEWTIEKKKDEDLGIYGFVLHLNPYSKPRKPQIIKGDNFLFIG